jgi:hypothetical protein
MLRRCLILALTALALTACGGERLSKSEYEQRVRETYAGVQQAFLATNVSSAALLAERVGKAQDSLREAADRLEDTNPPQEVEKQNDEIVAGLRAYADDLEELKEAAERGDRKAIARFNNGVRNNPAIARIAEAAEEMKEKQYDLGPIAEE